MAVRTAKRRSPRQKATPDARPGRAPSRPSPRYRRIVLKISGEGFCKPGGFGIDGEMIERIAGEVVDVARLGVQVAVVVGGGNFLRGATLAERSKIHPASAHYMGMLATVINALALQEVLEAHRQATRVQSAIAISAVCEPFIRRRCINHLAKGRIVILGAGTGRPFVTTDSAAALAAVEIGAEVLLKATKVDGVYSADPMKDKNARKFESLGYNQVIDERLKVMDVSAVDLCQQHGVPIVVFSLMKPGNMRRVVLGEHVGTVIAE